MSDYRFWINALKDPSKIGGKDLPVHESDPQVGFYRIKDMNGGDMLPVAIWMAQDMLMCTVSGKPRDAHDIWTFACRNPVSEHEYHSAIGGNGWADSAPKMQEAGMGHNLPEDPFEALTIEFNAEMEVAAGLLESKVSSQDVADKVANFTSRISALGKKAEEQFAIEKRPLLDASKACDNKWRDLRDGVKDVVTRLKRHLDSFLAEQRKIEIERQRKAEQAAAEKRAAAEAARLKAENQQSNPNDPEQEAAAAEAARLEAEAEALAKEVKAKPIQAGRTGSKVSMRTFTTGEIVDYDKALLAMKDHPEVKALIQTLANRAATKGVVVDGVKIVKEQRTV